MRIDQQLEGLSCMKENADKIFGFLLLISLLAGCASTVHQREASVTTARSVPTQLVPIPDGSIYKPSYAISLFEDSRARKVGDILTIILTEKTDAKKEASTNAKKETDISVGSATIFSKTVSLFGHALNSVLGSSHKFSGKGDNSQSNSLTGSVTVIVVDILPNRNLVVEGEKNITINKGGEFVRISGIVRPEDVQPDNSVLSTKVANADISYSGKGATADVNAIGWLARFFLSPFWPY